MNTESGSPGVDLGDSSSYSRANVVPRPRSILIALLILLSFRCSLERPHQVFAFSECLSGGEAKSIPDADVQFFSFPSRASSQVGLLANLATVVRTSNSGCWNVSTICSHHLHRNFFIKANLCFQVHGRDFWQIMHLTDI